MDEGFLRFFFEDLMALVDFEEVFFLLEDLLLFFGVMVWDFDLIAFEFDLIEFNFDCIDFDLMLF